PPPEAFARKLLFGREPATFHRVIDGGFHQNAATGAVLVVETLARGHHPAGAMGIYDEGRPIRTGLAVLHFRSKDQSVLGHAHKITVAGIVGVNRFALQRAEDRVIGDDDGVVGGAMFDHAHAARELDSIALRAV